MGVEWSRRGCSWWVEGGCGCMCGEVNQCYAVGKGLGLLNRTKTQRWRPERWRGCSWWVGRCGFVCVGKGAARSELEGVQLVGGWRGGRRNRKAATELYCVLGDGAWSAAGGLGSGAVGGSLRDYTADGGRYGMCTVCVF